MLKYKCLVLDHDDTVVQSESTVNYPYFAQILSVFRPGTSITLEQYMQGCFRFGFPEMCRRLYGFTQQELADEYRGWQAYILDHIPAPFPGIGRIIARQKAEGGILAVVSHSSASNITRDYRTHFGILPDAIYGWELPEHQRKPNAYPLRCLMEKYDLAPEDILVVDDMKPAWQMARAVGAPMVFAAWGRQDFPELLDAMREICDASFDSPAELEAYLFGGECHGLDR